MNATKPKRRLPLDPVAVGAHDSGIHAARGTKIAVAIAVGWALHATLTLEPVWGLAWCAPALLLAFALHLPQSEARWYVLLAALIGSSANFTYFRLLMPLPLAVLVTVGIGFLWQWTTVHSRLLMVRYGHGWTMVVFPVMWVAADTLMAALLPDGNVLSFAYTQAAILPVAQIASVAGVGGMLFVIMLANAAIAILLGPRPRARAANVAAAIVGIAIAIVVGFGMRRAATPPAGPKVRVGLASIDDAIGREATDRYAMHIRQQYDGHIATLAAAKATIVLLPEKIATLSTEQAQEWERHFSGLAATHRVWLHLGVAVDSTDGRRNLSWLFDPGGQRAAIYQKHFMAPPERQDIPGTAFRMHDIHGQSFGLAICKDMHFASFAREYGRQQADAMLVPAWDFVLDATWAERLTAIRGIENGYVVVRAAREGMLSVSDAYGRTLAETRSRPLPGVTLIATVNVPSRIPTVYGRIGDLFSWCCVALAVALFGAGMRAPHLIPPR